jgi:serine protease Do
MKLRLPDCPRLFDAEPNSMTIFVAARMVSVGLFWAAFLSNATHCAAVEDRVNEESADIGAFDSPSESDSTAQVDPLAELQRIESATSKLISKVSPCIVSIGESASGVIVKPTGIVITSSHVTRKAGRTLNVRMSDGRIVQGITLGSNAANDTSAIQLIDRGPWPFLKTTHPKLKPAAGQWCVAFGYPLSWPRDRPANARLGRITGQFKGKIVTDCPIMGGDSGGALVNLDGTLIAINSSVRLDVTQNLHVPIARYHEDWTTMMRRLDIDKPTLNQIVTRANDKTLVNNVAPAPKRIYLGVYAESINNAVRVRDVRRDSPAERSGLKPEDVIYKIDETPIDSFASLIRFLSKKKGNEEVTVFINRYGTPIQISLTLEAR